MLLQTFIFISSIVNTDGTSSPSFPHSLSPSFLRHYLDKAHARLKRTIYLTEDHLDLLMLLSPVPTVDCRCAPPCTIMELRELCMLGKHSNWAKSYPLSFQFKENKMLRNGYAFWERMAGGSGWEGRESNLRFLWPIVQMSLIHISVCWVSLQLSRSFFCYCVHACAACLYV